MPWNLYTSGVINGRRFVVIENSGVWTRDIYALPILIGDLISKFLDDTIGDVVYETMTEISNKYTVEAATERLENIYGGIFQTRTDLLQKVVDDYNVVAKKIEEEIKDETGISVSEEINKEEVK